MWREQGRTDNTHHVPSLVWFIIAVAVCAGLLYLSHRMEPHWVAKDGTRFLTTPQPIDRTGASVGRTRTGQYVVISVASKITTEVWFVDADDADVAPRVVEPRRQGVEYDVEHHHSE